MVLLFLSVMMKLVRLHHDVLGPNRFQLSVIILWTGDLACLEDLQKILYKGIYSVLIIFILQRKLIYTETVNTWFKKENICK